MNLKLLGTISLCATLASYGAPRALSDSIHDAPQRASASDFIDIFEKLSGVQQGIRKGHAKGVCANGTFLPSAAARQRFATPLFAAESGLVLRFSMAGGNPDADERALMPRGVGVKFLPQNASPHHIAGLTTPVFAGKNAEQFLGLLRVNYLIREGRATPADRDRYFENNPEAARQGQWLQAHPPAGEYSAARYFGVHTFLADTAEEQKTAFRWALVPADGEQPLSDEERRELPASFLEDRLKQRVAADGVVEMDWLWSLASATDDINDPSTEWPGDRETISVGKVLINSAGGTDCKAINFDPNRLTAGIHPSDDPVLKLRSAAYAISQGKRLSGQ